MLFVIGNSVVAWLLKLIDLYANDIQSRQRDGDMIWRKVLSIYIKEKVKLLLAVRFYQTSDLRI